MSCAAALRGRTRRDERGSIPVEVARFLRPCAKPGFSARTESNAHLSDAILVLVRDATDPHATPGTSLTIDLATRLGKPLKIVDPGYSARLTAEWIWRDLLCHRTLALPGHDSFLRGLMIAGPRESKWSGAQTETSRLLRCVGEELLRIAGPSREVG